MERNLLNITGEVEAELEEYVFKTSITRVVDAWVVSAVEPSIVVDTEVEAVVDFKDVVSLEVVVENGVETMVEAHKGDPTNAEGAPWSVEDESMNFP